MTLGEPGPVRLAQETANYVTRVHRLGLGDHFIAFDPERALEATAELIEVARNAITARVDALRPASLRPARRVTLIQATCKGDKMDAIVRDATELGITRIIPAITARSVSRPEPARADRWRRITVEAARQCGRGDAPVVEAPVALTEALALAAPAQEALAFCLDPRADRPLSARLRALSPSADVLFVVGPEGGLEETELAAAEAASFTRVRLGPLVLRAETVCAAVLGALFVLGASETHLP